MYNEFIKQLDIHTEVMRILTKGYLPISLLTRLKLKEILDAVKTMIRKTNPDYDIVLKRLHLYYNMKLVTFGIDRDRNLIIQFSVFIQPYTQQPLVLCQIETVPFPIIRSEHKGRFLHTFTGRQAIHCTKLWNIYHNQMAGTQNMQKNRLWILLWGTSW